jgi:hypothetical protein
MGGERVNQQVAPAGEFGAHPAQVSVEAAGFDHGGQGDTRTDRRQIRTFSCRARRWD